MKLCSCKFFLAMSPSALTLVLWMLAGFSLQAAAGTEASYCSEQQVQRKLHTCRNRLRDLPQAEVQGDIKQICRLVQSFLSCHVGAACTLPNSLREEQQRYRSQYSEQPPHCKFNTSEGVCDSTVIDSCSNKISSFEYLKSLKTFDAVSVYRTLKSSCTLSAALDDCLDGWTYNCPDSVQRLLDTKKRVAKDLLRNDCSNACITVDTEQVIRRMVQCHQQDSVASRKCSAGVETCLDQVTERHRDCSFYNVRLRDAMCSKPVSQAPATMKHTLLHWLAAILTTVAYSI